MSNEDKAEENDEIFHDYFCYPIFHDFLIFLSKNSLKEIDTKMCFFSVYICVLSAK